MAVKTYGHIDIYKTDRNTNYRFFQRLHGIVQPKWVAVSLEFGQWKTIRGHGGVQYAQIASYGISTFTSGL